MGVPADTAEVHAAKVAHAAAGGAVHPVHAFGYAAGYPYFGGLVGHANGAVVPVDTPEVHAAKVAHAAAGGAVHHAAIAPTPTLPATLMPTTTALSPCTLASLDLSPTPTAPLSQLSPLMWSPPGPSTLPLTLREPSSLLETIY